MKTTKTGQCGLKISTGGTTVRIPVSKNKGAVNKGRK
jgi:hypothetical protein